MPVGTQAAVKTLTAAEVEALGARIILANTYHLYLRPGHEVVQEMGGLHDFQGWRRPVLTDSGGFQVFSLADIRTVAEEGVTFRSHIDGSRHLFTPERVMEIQRALGADVVMAFDQCPPGQAPREVAEEAYLRTLRWLDRCRERFLALDREAEESGAGSGRQALFPIVQGGVFPELRVASARETLAAGDWHGIAVGGLSVGEPKPVMYAMLEALEPELPAGLPRYLMGVGYPEDLIEAIARGVDMFDCVAPTRNGRNGTVWLSGEGQVNVKGARFRADPNPLDAACACLTCQTYSRAYLRHLWVAGEPLVQRLLTVHNLHTLLEITRGGRQAVRERRFDSWRRETLARYPVGRRGTEPG
jgi:queuine tRNA-ribosyltransferase